MSCPYFYPLEARSTDAEPRSAMLPLGNFWTGICRAVPGDRFQPEQDVVRPVCQLGYARGQCERFPADDPGPDAVRFVIREDDGVSIRLQYVQERDHHPFAHGLLEYSLKRGQLIESPPDVLVCRQAEAYVASYLRRKAHP